LLVPLSNVLYDATGRRWSAVFLIAAALNIIAALMAVAVLRPLRKRQMATA
jgi:OFA family oxalate/formate antiporter-like MFS transporter